ncbi:MAG: flagellin, partial [Nitrospirae bacterium]
TGITATVDGGTITLTSDKGVDIGIENFQLGSAGTVDFAGAAGSAQTLTTGGNDSSLVGGTVTFASPKGFSVSSSIAAASGSLFNTAADQANNGTLSSVADIDIGTQSGANAALDVIDGALSFVNSVRGDLGAIQNRFTSTIANLQNVTENVSAARSRIQDADFAQETSNLTKNQILQQAGISVLAQANQLPSTVLKLLG